MSPHAAVAAPLISVIVPCYNHGIYLRDAFASIQQQDYSAIEIVLVDDGSTDATRQVAADYPTIKYIYQPNQGLSAARNTGIAHSTGRYLVFLDADDWLLPGALQTNARYLQQRPELAFVSGGHTKVFVDTGLTEESTATVTQNHYYHLLWGNYIGMHAAVMYQRWIFDFVQFDTTLAACEDYDLYLRITRAFPVAHHPERVAAYRLHSANMSGDKALMLTMALAVLARQWPYLQSPMEKEAYAQGQISWQRHYRPDLAERGQELGSPL